MSGNRLALHVGTHKTGTSAIQNYLHRHREKLSAEYLYRQAPNSSLWMLQAFAHDLRSFPVYKHENLSKQKLESIKRLALKKLTLEISKLDGRDAILSAESLSTLTKPELEAVHKYFRDRFHHIDVIVYFRPMKSRIESAFQERLRRRFVTLVDRYSLGYAARMRILDDVFGGNNVHAYRYERKDFPNGSVVHHSMDAIGEKFIPETASLDNTSLSLPAVQLLYAYRQQHPQPQPEDVGIIERLAQLPGKPLRFHSALFQKLCLAKKDGIRNFEQRTGFSISEDIEAADEFAVRNELDLLTIPDSSLQWLQENAKRGTTDQSRFRHGKSIAEQVQLLS